MMVSWWCLMWGWDTAFFLMGYCFFLLPFLACNPYIKKDQRDHRRDGREKNLIFLKNTELKFWPVVSAFYVIVRANSASKGRCVPTQFWGSQDETNTFGPVIAVHGSIPILSTNYGSTNTSVKRTQILSNLCLPRLKFYVYVFQIYELLYIYNTIHRWHIWISSQISYGTCNISKPPTKLPDSCKAVKVIPQVLASAAFSTGHPACWLYLLHWSKILKME